MIYLDSSVLLHVYLGQAHAEEAREILGRPAEKVASWILAIEVPVVLRRLLGGSTKRARSLRDALELFDRDCRAISLFANLPDLASRIRQEPRFARCRALDAIHAGTALQLQEMANHPVYMATFDDDLASTATSLGLSLATGG